MSNLNAPAALLTNTTRKAGHFLAVKIVGVVSARDAVGTVVSLTAGGSRIVRQLTGGDGYQSCNQRMLVFGIGAATEIEELHVRWPSGRQATFQSIPIDAEVLLIEGTRQPLVLRVRTER